MAEQKKETFYQVKGADGMYHSVPESRLEEYRRQQKELLAQGKDEEYWNRKLEERLAKTIAESTPEELAMLRAAAEDLGER